MDRSRSYHYPGRMLEAGRGGRWQKERLISDVLRRRRSSAGGMSAAPDARDEFDDVDLQGNVPQVQGCPQAAAPAFASFHRRSR